MPIDKVKFPNGETEDIRDSRISGVDSTPTSGSANLVTSGGVKVALDGKMNIGGAISDFNTETTPGNYAIDYTVSANRPSINYGQALVLNAATDTVAQLAFNYNSGSAYFRGGSGWGSTWNSWREFAFKDDLSTALSGYLPLTGGTMANTNLVTNLNADLLDGMDSASYLHKLSRNLDANSNPYGVWSAVSAPSSAHMPGSWGTLFAIQGDYTAYKGQLYIRADAAQLNVRGGNGDNWWDWKTVAFTDSNVASATKLQTARSIWGQNFDGTDSVDGILSLSYASTYRATGIEVTSSDSGEASIGFTSTNRTVFGRYNNRGFIWGSVAGEIMTLLDNGNIGIGTDTPTEKLDVRGNIRVFHASDGQRLASFVNYESNPYGMVMESLTDGTFLLQSQREADNSQTFALSLNPRGGNVGIGTTSPASKLTVAGTIRSENQSDGSPSFRTDGANSYTAFASFLGGSRKWQMDTINDGSMRLYLDSAGKYLLNMWPSGTVEIDGGITTTLQTSEPSGGMLPNREYQLGTLSGNTTFTLAAGTSGVTNHYFWSFETGSTAPTITWPSGITSWYGGSAPTINASKHYEVSVLNGVAVVMEV